MQMGWVSVHWVRSLKSGVLRFYAGILNSDPGFPLGMDKPLSINDLCRVVGIFRSTLGIPHCPYQDWWFRKQDGGLQRHDPPRTLAVLPLPELGYRQHESHPHHLSGN